MKTIVTLIPKIQLQIDFILFLSFVTNQNQKSGFQQIGGLVTRNNFFCSKSCSASKPYRLQQTFVKEFSYKFLCSYYNSMLQTVEIKDCNDMIDGRNFSIKE